MSTYILLCNTLCCQLKATYKHSKRINMRALIDTMLLLIQVIADLEKVREHLTRPENFRVHIAASTASLSKLGQPQVAWKQFLPKEITAKLTRLVIS